MNNRAIGRIIAISHNSITAELSVDVGNYVSIYDAIRFVGEIGSYVAIDDINRRIIAEIIAVDEKNESSSERLSKPIRYRYLRISLIGEISNNSFKFGVTKMPPIFSEIKIISELDLHLMLDITDNEEATECGGTKLKALSIGESVLFPDYEVKVKLNEFFGFHFTVFGNTGSGKSNTIARMVQTIFLKKDLSARGAKFIVFDSNGEYKTAFEKVGTLNPDIKVKFINTSGDGDEKIEIPVWALSVDDWAILLHASEKTQVPIIARALELIQVFDSTGEISENELKIRNHIIATVIRGILSGQDSVPNKSDKIKAVINNFSTGAFSYCAIISNELYPEITLQQSIEVHFGEMKQSNALVEYCEQFIQPNINVFIEQKKATHYSMKQFEEAIRLAVLYEGSVSSSRIYEYTATLVTRLKHLIESEQGSFFVETEFASVKEYVENIIGNNQLLNIDISSLDDTATEVITKVFSKMLFDYIRTLDPRNSMPVNLILEEAHRFIRTDMDYGVLGYNIFERIAKEGRKYGLLMGISSQRPSELSKTVVSQCSNFIIHKIQNPDDIQYISRMVPYVNQSIIDRITYLQRGHALVFGTAINLPTLTKFEKADPMPNSSNSDITEKWYRK
jgi:DNA helicase HerA-like ATPase